MNSPFGGPDEIGFGVFGVLGVIVWGFFALLSLAVAIGLIFLLVRFLLVGTRAAQLYISKNEAARPVQTPPPARTPPAEAAPSSVAPPTSTAPTAPVVPEAPTAPSTPPSAAMSSVSARAAAPVDRTAAAKPAAKPRTRKAPPAVDQA